MCVCVCVCVCSGGLSSDSTTINEAVYCNFDLRYLPCCLHPTPSDIPCEEGGSLEGRVQFFLEYFGEKLWRK